MIVCGEHCCIKRADRANKETPIRHINPPETKSSVDDIISPRVRDATDKE